MLLRASAAKSNDYKIALSRTRVITEKSYTGKGTGQVFQLFSYDEHVVYSGPDARFSLAF